MPRFYVRCSEEEAIVLERYARVAGLAVGGVLREVTLAFGPVWVANRAADKVSGRDVKPLRRANGRAS